MPFQLHQTANNGPAMPIGTMTDEHLVNYIRQTYARRIEPALQAMRNPVDGDEFQSALYDLRKIDPKEAANIIRETVTRLFPYLVEAYLRGLPEPQALLREALGRCVAIGFVQPILPELPDVVEE